MASRKAVGFLRLTARVILAITGLFWFVFAALSGAGDGIGGLWANLPNALPWLGLIALFFISLRWELLGGVLVLAFGLASVAVFSASAVPVVLAGLSLPVIASGVALIICHWLDRGGAGNGADI